ncbi:hypothetical protein EIP86_005148 [Pleurotus ostreatoroseus]|nr:hypothetical protein EIP86_005148 [Pleurotus ostreatoroseus]
MATPAASVEINDALFCQSHLKEVCEDCSFDGREDNDAFFGFDPIDRDGLEAPLASPNKDGVYQCKKHTSPTCNQCFGWKKQLTRARAAAKKAGKKSDSVFEGVYRRFDTRSLHIGIGVVGFMINVSSDGSVGSSVTTRTPE